MEMESTSVVTAFVYSGDRVALVKRSDKVRSYNGRWAAFSGYVEDLPLRQAMTELFEEAGLSPEDVVLRGMGIPMPVDDAEEGYRWLVFPFLFHLKGGREIKTDWEASSLEWFRQEDMGELHAVPGLREGLCRVWPPFGTNDFWHELAEVATDTEHGATELARRGLRALGAFVQKEYDSLQYDGLVRSVRAFASARPVMGVFPNLAARLLMAMDREGGQFDFDTLITELMSAVEDSSDISSDVTADALADRRTVMTISYSESVLNALVKWNGIGKHVTVAESLPDGEGRLFAEALAGKGISAEVMADADAPLMVKEVDAVLVGCDGITGGSEIINKFGTAGLVTSANDEGVPTYAVSQSFKICPSGWPVFLEVRKEVGGARRIFDLTPIERFTAVYTEDGSRLPRRLAEIRAELDNVPLLYGSQAG
jgi:translation initiation factor 2B subunit (eIF-2B alpha/beta/delta family)